LVLNNNFTGTVKNKFLIRPTDLYAAFPSKFSSSFEDEVYKTDGIFRLTLPSIYAIRATDAGNINSEPPLCESSHVPVKPYMRI
jgi:hypothetical protein